MTSNIPKGDFISNTSSFNVNNEGFSDLRNSLGNNLIKGDYLKALDKISDNIANIRNNIKELRNYLISIGSKKDNKSLNEQVNQILNSTGNLFKESMILSKDFKDFRFPNKNDQTANLKQLRIMESKCADMKSEFDSITYKISRQNKSMIDSQRNSMTTSITVSNNPLEVKTKTFMAADFLEEDRLIEKEKQNNQIEKINKDLFDLSVIQNQKIQYHGEIINTIEDNVVESHEHIVKATEEIKESNEIVSDGDSFLNKVCIFVIVLVAVLLILMMITPK